MKLLIPRATLALCAALAGVSPAAGAAPSARAILDATGIRGGLCLVVGAPDTTLAEGLAAASTLYVQALQPDAKRALAWGTTVAGSANRDKVGIRHAPFDPDHYGSELFNLIVVLDADALRQAQPAEFFRILAPHGAAVFSAAALKYTTAAKALGMDLRAVAGLSGVCFKPAKSVTWKPCDSLKWRAGMRAHMSVGICGPTHGAGRFFYREKLESADGWPNDTSQLVARDDFNGRVLWVRQEEVPWTRWGVNQFNGNDNWTLGADGAGRLFAVTRDGRLVCMDGATGEERFELLSRGAKNGYVYTYMNKYVLYMGTVFSAETGKPLWGWKGRYMALNREQDEETLVESDGTTLYVRSLADGKEISRATLDWRGDRAAQGGKRMELIHLGDYIIVAEGRNRERPYYLVTAIDPAIGKKLWSNELTGSFGLPHNAGKDKQPAGVVRYVRMGDQLLAYCHTQYYHIIGDDQKEVHFTAIDLATGKAVREDYGPKGRVMASACGTDKAMRLGDYLTYHHNVWLNYKTMERVFPLLLHPSCNIPPSAANGMLFNSPGRKGGHIQGITAIGPADIAFDQAPGGQVFQRYAPRPAFDEPTRPGDWPTFRGNNARGNATVTALGGKLALEWETQVGLGGHTYGRMYSERTGITQAVIAYGMAYVADIDAQRIVALDVADGRQRWIYPVGSRVDFPPTLYRGLCLFASKDGFVHCIDARSGQPVYKLLIAPRERYIGGQEKLESLWPTAADVMVDKEGVCHASAGFASPVHGGVREVTFRAETGEVTGSKVYFEEWTEAGYPHPKDVATIFTEPLDGGWRLSSNWKSGGTPIDDMLGYGNSISRNNEDRAKELFSDHPVRGKERTSGKVIAFDEQLCVAHFVTGGAAWALMTPIYFQASERRPSQSLVRATPAWRSPPVELIADDIVLTPDHVYGIGHYRRQKGDPEIVIMSRADGQVVGVTPVNGLPAYLGTSAAGNRLFVATRDGKLLCYRAE